MATDKVKHTAEVLREALDSFGPDGQFWIKGMYSDERGGQCCSGAVGGPDTDAWKILVACLPANCGLVSAWNDADDRTFEDVKQLFTQAIQSGAKTMTTKIMLDDLQLFMDGDMWCATRHDFTNPQESPAGFGVSQEIAIAELQKAETP